MSGDRPCPARSVRLASGPRGHVPLRPIWLCRACGLPWPCGRAKLDLLAEYHDSMVSLFLYLASQFHDAIDDLHKVNAGVCGSVAGLFDRFLSWPARHTRSYRVSPSDRPGEAEG